MAVSDSKISQLIATGKTYVFPLEDKIVSHLQIATVMSWKLLWGNSSSNSCPFILTYPLMKLQLPSATLFWYFPSEIPDLVRFLRFARIDSSSGLGISVVVLPYPAALRTTWDVAVWFRLLYATQRSCHSQLGLLGFLLSLLHVWMSTGMKWSSRSIPLLL